ncbi:MAG: ATP-binding protein [Calditrichaeota bacterium]|nr:MAG: ATP-binding protein [Calditrichota bacterium]
MGAKGELAKLSAVCNKAQDAIEFRVPSDPKVLKIVRLSISHLCELAGFTEEERNSTTLAVDEACSNIIRHAYDGAHDKPIVITFKMMPKGIEIVICDFGKNISKSKIKSRDLEKIRPGGLGVHLIQSVMDVVTYERIPRTGNKLTLGKFKKVK